MKIPGSDMISDSAVEHFLLSHTDATNVGAGYV